MVDAPPKLCQRNVNCVEFGQRQTLLPSLPLYLLIILYCSHSEFAVTSESTRYVSKTVAIGDVYR